MVTARIRTVSLSMVVVVYAIGAVLIVSGLKGAVAWLLLGLFAGLGLVVLTAPLLERASGRVLPTRDPWVQEWQEIWRRPVC